MAVCTSYLTDLVISIYVFLRSLYETMFSQYDVPTSQILLTSFDFASPERCENVQVWMAEI